MLVNYDGIRHSLAPCNDIYKVKVWLHSHWLLRCPLKFAPHGTASAHFRGYFNA